MLLSNFKDEYICIRERNREYIEVRIVVDKFLFQSKKKTFGKSHLLVLPKS